MLELQLFPGLPGGRRARLGPITGEVETAIDPGDPAGFGQLLDRLFLPDEGTTVGPGRAFDLAVCDHDRLAAALYHRSFGGVIESTARCRQCGRDYEVSFDLAGVGGETAPESAEDIEGPDAHGMFRLSTGEGFRLPSLRDHLAVRDLPSAQARGELARRCTESPPKSEEAMEAIEEAMGIVGPLVAGELAADCPHCHFHEDTIHFSIQQFLLDALAFDQRFLPYEVHCLARTYGWTRKEILGMPSDERRQHARMILADSTAG